MLPILQRIWQSEEREREGKRAPEAREGLQCVFTTPHPNHCHIRLSLAANYISLSLFFLIPVALNLCLVIRKPAGFSASISLHTIASSMLGEKSYQSTFLILSLSWSKRKLNPMPHITTQDSPFLGLNLLLEFSPPVPIRPSLHFSHMGPPLPKNVCYFPPTLHLRLPSSSLPYPSPTNLQSHSLLTCFLLFPHISFVSFFYARN